MKKRLFIWVLVLWGSLTPFSSAANFEGIYLINAWQEENILDTLNMLSQSEITLTITEDGNIVPVTAGRAFSGDYSLLSANLAELSDLSEGNSVYSIFISSGSHLAMAYIHDQTSVLNEREISLLNGSWLKSESEQAADISSLFGAWNITQYSNPNLRSGITEFNLETGDAAIKAGSSSDTIMVQFPETWIEMQVSGSRVYLDPNQGPVDTGDGILHQFEAWFDDTGFSYTWIMVEDYDDTDVSVQIGYSNYQVPVPGTLLLFVAGLFGLSIIRTRLSSDIRLSA